MKKYFRSVFTREDLEETHTRALMLRRDFFYGVVRENNEFVNVRNVFDDSNYFASDRYYGTEADARREMKDIYEILATREHIPNKKEAKIIRQEKAKKQCS